jgi:RNA polymerase sigma-32 factor
VLLARKRRGGDFSLNTPIGVGDEEREWQDILEDDAPNAEDALGDEQERALQLAKINSALATLSERERTILQARNDGVRLEALAQRFGISRERVRQIEVRAIEKARAHAAA